MSRSRAKGTRFESEVVSWLREHGHPHCERRAMQGANDCGDIAGFTSRQWNTRGQMSLSQPWVLELKALRELDVAGAMDEAEKERANAGARWCAAILKRRRRGVGDAYVVMTLEQFARLLSEEG